MKKQVSDFTGIDIYVGLDVHKKNWSVTVVVSDLVTKSFSQEASATSLLRTLGGLYPNGNFHFVYEAGFSGFWLQRFLDQAGHDCIVVHPPDIPRTDRDRKRKNDRLDSRKLAKLLSKGVLRGIWIPTPEQESARALVRSRKAFRKDLTRSQNRIKMFLLYIGADIPARFSGKWSKAFVLWLTELELPLHSRIALDIYLKSYHAAKEILTEVDRQIKKLAASPTFAKGVRQLTSTPGIGLLSAMIILSEVADIKRFASRDHFCSFAGLVPNFHNSGEQSADGPITMRRNAMLRNIIIECAWVAIRHDPALTIAFSKYKQRMIGSKAIVKIARKLLARIRHLLISGESYQIGVVG